MGTIKRLRILATVAAVGALVLSGATAAAGATPKPKPYTCTGGDIPSGNYARISVTGTCDVPADAVITVVGSVSVGSGATLDAQSAPSTITVGQNVTAASGSLLGLGCQPDFPDKTGHACTVEPDGHSVITVNGNVTAVGSALVLLNGITVKGNVSLVGGGSPNAWSIKNNTIAGNVTVSGLTVEWLGLLFNSIGKNVTVTAITVNDVDPGAPGVYVVRNTIGRNLTCLGLTPGVSGGFIPGEVNVVGRHAIGQCASLV